MGLNFLHNLWRSKPNEEEGPPQQSRMPKFEDIRYTNWTLLPILGIGLILVFFYARLKPETATALLWSLACLLGGATLGFLFGIPKVLQGNRVTSEQEEQQRDADEGNEQQRAERKSRYGQQVNTNLTEISDWLTKIIVGLGLINLEKIPGKVSLFADNLARGINNTDPTREKGFALAVVMGFSLLGFLLGYLYTRLFLQGAFARADQWDQAGSKIQRDTQKLVQDKAMAEKIEQFAPGGGAEQAHQLIADLARQYEQIRNLMSPGDERTRQMDIILTEMRKQALAGYSELPSLIKSQSAGERLAAVAMLQVNPDRDQFDWLAARLSQEKPFIGYHAAVALLTAVRTLEKENYPALKEALEKAQTSLGNSLKGSDRMRVLEKALKELQAKQSSEKELPQ